MHIRVIGDAQDVTGFALAGIQGEECRTRAELVHAIENLRHDPDVGVVLLSAAVAALGDDVVSEMRNRTDLPITIVLPPAPAREAPAEGEA